MELTSNTLELLKIDDSVFIFVKKSIDSSYSILSLGLSNFWGNGVNKLIKVNWLIFVLNPIDKTENERISFVEAEFFKNFVDFSRVNGSTSVLIKDLKGVFELFIILWSEAILPSEGSCGFGLCGWLGLAFRSSAHVSANVNKKNQIRYDLSKGLK